jgi:hypothetical protein
MITIKLLLLLCISVCVLGCYLHGTDSGFCDASTSNKFPGGKIRRRALLPFCWRATPYPICMPKLQIIPATREFPEGRWFNNTPTQKDMWVEESFIAYLAYRIKWETSSALRRAGTNEYGDKGRIKSRFNKNKDCVNAYKNLFCWINFPRCDVEKDLTLPTCLSACENYFKSCRHKKDLHRCGPMEYFNGYEPEKPQSVDINGKGLYLRDYFPGAPWIPNKFDPDDRERQVCTPSLTGSAFNSVFSSLHSIFGLIFYCFVAVTFAIFIIA